MKKTLVFACSAACVSAVVGIPLLGKSKPAKTHRAPAAAETKPAAKPPAVPSGPMRPAAPTGLRIRVSQ
jgi:hypothetical protein